MILRLHRRAALAGLAASAIGGTSSAASVESRFFAASDGTRLHYLEAGPPGVDRTIVLVPGWTMPAWIWGPQIEAFARRWRVVAFDPRGQGESEVAASGYEPGRRGQDIADLLAQLAGPPALLVAWSLGVLDSLAYVHARGDARVAGLVLVDNSVGEEPPPAPPPKPNRHAPRLPHDVAMDRFVRGMFQHPQSEDYLVRLVRATLVTPEPACRALLAYPVPRTYWREAVYSTAKPVLYVVRPHLQGQAANLALHHPAAETAMFATAGHALFVDEPARFDAVVEDFIARRVWP